MTKNVWEHFSSRKMVWKAGLNVATVFTDQFCSRCLTEHKAEMPVTKLGYSPRYMHSLVKLSEWYVSLQCLHSSDVHNSGDIAQG